MSTLNFKTPKQLPNTVQKVRVGKNDARHWLPRMYHPVNAQGKASPHYAMQLQFKGYRLAFGLRTSNREAAARRAAGIYGDLVSVGVEGTLAKHRAKRPETEDIATVGEYLRAAQSVMAVRPASFAAYAYHLRRITGDIIGERSPRKAKIRAKRETRQAIEDASLTVLSASAVQTWRLAFVSRAKGDGARARSARISCNSIIRQARSLFAPKVVKFLSGTLRLPQPLPFTGAALFPRESMRYISRIDAGALLRKAQEELADEDPDTFLAILLALSAGLRRGEIDQLLWQNVDLDGCRIIVEDSEHGRLKTEESRGAVDIDQHMTAVLRGFRAKATGPFVLEATRAVAGESSREWGPRYRCVTAFERANHWLRTFGVTGNKPLHTLRKESGSLITTRDGIFAASAFLRHRDIGVTSAFYADKKTRTVVDVGVLLKANEAQPENIVSLPRREEQTNNVGHQRRKARRRTQ